MSIKMIVTDLDRTLLRTDKTISDKTAAVLNRCRKQGVKIVFATARPKNRIDIFSFINIASALISDNGAVVYMDNKITDSFGIPAAIAKPFVRKLVAAVPNERTSIEYPHLKIANFDKSEVWFADIVNDIDHPLDIDATKIVVNAGVEIYNKVFELLHEDIYAQLCEERLILIMHRTATKWNAIQTVAAHFNISANEISAFGDDYNDVEMLRECGIGVAVANAIDEAKAAADYLCDTNDNDGVAKWLEENVL
ncbi:MAG: HAD-IIB family hydrolase [Oscillospiraceae bacterium]|nr:HAD-IIB family hydrolase [Oscillospiraceae bacterium]